MPYLADKHEKEILEHWKNTNAFEQSVESRPEDKPYVFYDGPPFATGLPHYGHILSSVIKDVVPRYWTMKGYRVRRRWGWDCHGLPIESLIEKELKLSGKKQIETDFGVEKFNNACRDKVLTYTREWKAMVDRIGRWIEFDNSYKTMDPEYMESVWWALKTIWDKGLIYEGRKVLMYCPRCETPVSKAEIAMDNSYKDITEESAIAKFRVVDPGAHDLPENTSLLAWTTTPWTLPGNVALAVGEKILYTVVKQDGEHYIVADELVEKVFDGEYEKVSSIPGNVLVGVKYEPLFDMPAMKETGKDAYYVAVADFVTTEEGTGVVHTAVMYGEDDYQLGLKLNLPTVPMLDGTGVFNEAAPENVRGQYFKDAEKVIKKDLESRGLLFARKQYTHSYPHCWRCDTQLFYNAISAWFINIQEIKKKLIANNKNVNWFPGHLKEGRFLNVLETAPDWNISRNRYWATALPFWKCDGDCDDVVCVGSVEELKEKATNFSDVYKTDELSQMDLHKHKMDQIKLSCEKCSGQMSRVPEVIDCWVEAASMPYAEFHHPFENNETFKSLFPGQYIAEYINQTRAWFYYMHVMGALLFDSHTFENVVTTGTILNEKGEKLSKSKRNFTDPWIIIEQYGVDALRYYLMTSVVMQADNLFFHDREVRDIYNKVLNTTWNVVTFYEMFAEEKGEPLAVPSEHVLDKWIMARLGQLRNTMTEHMDNYDTVRAGRPIQDFVLDLSQWYVRRSRDRFKGSDEADKQAAIATLHDVLFVLSKLMAPFMPFMADKIYLTLKKYAADPSSYKDSVHLEMWPEEMSYDEGTLTDMSAVRKAVELGLSLRKEHGVRVRQPLAACTVTGLDMNDGYAKLIKDELNVKDVLPKETKEGDWQEKGYDELVVTLNMMLTDELKKEGMARELIRAINQLRKEAKLTLHDTGKVIWSSDDQIVKDVFGEFTEQISTATRSTSLEQGAGESEVSLPGATVHLTVTKE